MSRDIHRNDRFFKYKLILEDDSFCFVYGLDEDDAIGVYVMSGGDANKVVDVLPAFSQKKQNKNKKFDDEDTVSDSE